jgi:O-antigen/teichoic acid export membrane protein
MALAAPYLAVHLFNIPQMAASVRWAALFLFCSTVNGVQTGVLAGFENFRAVASVNVTRGGTTLLLTIPFVMLWHVEGAFAAMALAGCLSYCMSLFQIAVAKQTYGIPRTCNWDWKHLRVLWTFSLPSVLAGLLVSPVTWMVSLWLSKTANGYGELGLFGAANQWRIIVAFIPLTLCQPLLPLLTSLNAKRDRSFNRVLSSSIAFTSIVSLIVAGVIVIVIPILQRFYGKGYGSLTPVLIPLLFSGITATACSTVANALASRERMWTNTVFNLFWAFTLLTTAHYAIPLAGAQGLAYSFLAAQLLLFCISIFWAFSFSRNNA